MRKGKNNSDMAFAGLAATRERVLDEVLPNAPEGYAYVERDGAPQLEQVQAPVDAPPVEPDPQPPTAEAPKADPKPRASKAAPEQKRLTELEARLGELGPERQLGARIPAWLYEELEDHLYQSNRGRGKGAKISKEAWVVRAVVEKMARDAVEK